MSERSIIDFFKNPQQPARQLGMTRPQIVQSRKQYAKNSIALGKCSDSTYFFTFSKRDSIIGSFVLIFEWVYCPQNTVYYELNLESVKKGPQIEVCSFFSGPLFKDPTAGDAMFVASLKEITDIMSELRFDTDVFLRIAQAIVPKEYVVVMHKECDEQIPERLFNPFSIPVDYFSVQMGPQKRARSQFSSEPAVEVVDAKSQAKRRRS
jgi:hypothetical protein